MRPKTRGQNPGGPLSRAGILSSLNIHSSMSIDASAQDKISAEALSRAWSAAGAVDVLKQHRLETCVPSPARLRGATPRNSLKHSTARDTMRTTVFPGNLAPIVVDVDCKGVRHVDSFLWSLDSARMAPEEFARQTVDDLQLPQECVALIAASLREQLAVAKQLQKFVERRQEPLLPRHVTLVVDATNEQKRFCDEFVWDTLDSSCDKPELLARRTCADMGLVAPFDAAVAFAIRRQLYRVALGFRPHENKASTQRDFPMPGRAEPHCWQARDPRDPRAQVPGPQPIGDPPPRLTGLNVFASKWHENRAAKLAADQPVPDISVEEAWANLPPETRERFEQVARKGGK